MGEAAGIVAEDGCASGDARQGATRPEPLQIYSIENHINTVRRNFRSILQALTAAVIHGDIPQNSGEEHRGFSKSTGSMAYEYGRHGKKLQQRFND